MTWQALTAMVRDITGRRIVQIPTPLAIAKATGRTCDVLRRVQPAPDLAGS